MIISKSLKVLVKLLVVSFAIFFSMEMMAADIQAQGWVKQSDILQKYLHNKNDPEIVKFVEEGKRVYSHVFKDRKVMINYMRTSMVAQGIEELLFDLALVQRFQADYYEPAKAIGEAITLCNYIKKRTEQVKIRVEPKPKRQVMDNFVADNMESKRPIIDKFAADNNISDLKLYIRNVKMDQKDFRYAQKIIVDDYLKDNDIEGLGKYIYWNFNDDEQDRVYARNLIIDDYVKKGDMKGLEEYVERYLGPASESRVYAQKFLKNNSLSEVIPSAAVINETADDNKDFLTVFMDFFGW